MNADLGPAHAMTIDGTEVTYHRHLCGAKAGSIHTYLGDFGSFEELVGYVRGRNAAPKDVPTPYHPRRGEAPSERDRPGYWSGVRDGQDVDRPVGGQE